MDIGQTGNLPMLCAAGPVRAWAWILNFVGFNACVYKFVVICLLFWRFFSTFIYLLWSSSPVRPDFPLHKSNLFKLRSYFQNFSRFSLLLLCCHVGSRTQRPSIRLLFLVRIPPYADIRRSYIFGVQHWSVRLRPEYSRTTTVRGEQYLVNCTAHMCSHPYDILNESNYYQSVTDHVD